MELSCVKALKKGLWFSRQASKEKQAFLCMALVQRGFLVTLTSGKLNKKLLKIVTNLGFVWLMLEIKGFGD